MNFNFRTSILPVCLAFFCLHTVAQVNNGNTSADIYEQLRKLNVLGSVLYVGAHPDDENTGLLTYLSKERKYRTAYLSLTRGDGGQNLIGDEQGVTLGLIRTEELLAARRVDGAEQFFSTARDFGFSKNPEETFTIWNKEKILSDVVFVIRYFQPDVIITRFPEDSRAGHGHHSASAILAREGFFAAADPNRFPEHFKFGLKPWQAKRVLWNTFNFGNTNTTSSNQYRINVGGYNALLGKSYGEIAAHSRSQHKSQGFGVASQRGDAFEYFVPIAGDTVFTDLMDGVDITWKRTGDASVEGMVQNLLQQFDFTQPEKTVAGLIQLREHFHDNLNESRWVTHKLKEIDKLISACTGLYFEATTSQPFAVTGDSLLIRFSVINRSHVPVSKLSIHYIDTTITINETLPYNVPKIIYITRLVRGGFMQDQPYWLREQMTEGAFSVSAQALLMNPRNDPNDVRVSYYYKENLTVNQNYPLQYKYTDPVKGELYEPVITVPPVIVSVFPSVVLNNVVPKVPPRIMVRYQSLSEKGTKAGEITFSNGQTTLSRKPAVLSLDKNRTTEVHFLLDTLLKVKSNTELSAAIVLRDSVKEQPYSNYMRLVKYDHIPAVHYFYQSKVKVLTDEVKVVGKRVGYIRGAGDNVPEALQAMGYEVVFLNADDIVLPKLATLDAVITGVRAYNVHDWLEGKYEVLMNYVKNGGNLIVQYNTSNFISSVTKKMGPYPFDISRNRVTDENSKVEFLLPKHQVLNYPNKITDKDFENWVQERGIYFADKLDPAYEAPLAMKDPGDPAMHKGSLIIANYGKGKFVYTGLVFFRELPAGVPGAYRLLANIIALNQKKGF
jgi:Uncharacterized proteins, LmbE homologs